MQIEQLILVNLLNNEDYTRRVIPFLKKEYFQDMKQSILFEKIHQFIEKYNGLPTKETLLLEIEKDNSIGDQLYSELNEQVNDLKYEKKDSQWLIDNTENFCQDKAIYNAIMDSIKIIDGQKLEGNKNSIPNILSDALAVSFDNNIGHDFLNDAAGRYEFYNRTEERIPFDIDLLNDITKGGLPNKTLNVLLAGTGVGKTLAMCHFAASNLMDGKNVLYITLEMAEERIAERIDSNLLNIPVDELISFPEKLYTDKIENLKKKTPGKLIIKEYPTASVNAAHFRHLINELKLKKDFKPDIIYVDYLNICSSSRMRGGNAAVNTYTYIKAIAEELRGLAVEKDVPIVSATQLTRSGYTSSDPGLEDTSESFALPATVDFMIALVSSEELEQLGQIQVKQLKNRYNDPTKNRKFVIGVDRPKMRLYNTDPAAQTLITEGEDDKPVFDKSRLGQELMIKGKGKKKDFSNLFGD